MKSPKILVTLALFAVVAVVASLWFASGVRADPPSGVALQGGAPMLINYQGRLEDPATGNPKPDGSYSMTFRIYDAVTGGTQVWSETQTVTVAGGLFNVLLGSSSALSAANFSGPDRWLQVEVGGQVLTPRQRLASVPYAIQAEKAEDADTLDGSHGSAFAGATHNHDATYVNEGQANSITSTMIVDGTIVDADISSTAAIAPSKISGTAWTSTNDGAGSGLDADLLDGQHASAFAGASHTHSSAAITDEPGMVGRNSVNPIIDSTSWLTVVSITLNAPAAGYALVQATGDVWWTYSGGTYVLIGIGTSASSVDNYVRAGVPSGSASGTYIWPFAVSRIYQVSAGSNTFYLNAKKNSTSAEHPYVYATSFQALYFPTAYGSISLGATPARAQPFQGRAQ